MVVFNFCVPLFCGMQMNVMTSPGLPSFCLGEYFKVFFVEYNIELLISGNTLFEKAGLWTGTVIIFFCMSNIPDFYFIYCCSKEVKRSQENVKNMMSNQAYLKRKR